MDRGPENEGPKVKPLVEIHLRVVTVTVSSVTRPRRTVMEQSSGVELGEQKLCPDRR